MSTCVVVFAYTAVQPDELTVNKDEVLTLVKDVDGDPGWVRVKNGINEVGIVPEGYLQSTTTSETTTTSDSSNVISDGSGGDDTDVATHYTAKFSYQSTAEDELSLFPGDKLKLVGAPQADGWAKAIKVSDNSSGLVPINYIEKNEHFTPVAPGAGKELTNILQRRRRMSDGIGLQMRATTTTSASSAETSEKEMKQLKLVLQQTESPITSTLPAPAPAPAPTSTFTFTSTPVPPTSTTVMLPSPAEANVELKRSMTVAETERAEQDVVDWLNNIGKDYGKKYGQMLIDDGYDSLAELPDVTMEDLEGAGVKKAHARKIVAAAAAMNDMPPATATVTAPATVTTPELLPLINMTQQTMTSTSSLLSTPLTTMSNDVDMPWVITDVKRAVYEKQYLSLSLPSLATYQQVLPFFQKSGLDNNMLMTVLSLSDANHDHLLSCDEFCVAFHIVGMVSRFHLDVPEVLSPSLLHHATKSTSGDLQNRESPASSMQDIMGLDIFETKAAPPPRPVRKSLSNKNEAKHEQDNNPNAPPPPALPPRVIRPPRGVGGGESSSSNNSNNNNTGSSSSSSSSSSMHTADSGRANARISFSSASSAIPISSTASPSSSGIPPVPPARRKSVARRAFNFLDKKLVAGGDTKEGEGLDSLILNARAGGSMAGHLLLRKVEKKSLSLTNWKKRRVVFSGARFCVYKPGDDNKPSEELLLLHSSKVVAFQNDKKDTKTYGFRILHVTELPTRTYRQDVTARVGDTQYEANMWIERIRDTIQALSANVARTTPNLTGRNARQGMVPVAGAAVSPSVTMPPMAVAMPVTGGGGSGGGRSTENIMSPSRPPRDNVFNTYPTAAPPQPTHSIPAVTNIATVGGSMQQHSRGQPVYRRNQLKGLEAYEDLQLCDGSARLLSQMVDSLDDAEDLKSQVFGELVENLTGKREELTREISGVTDANSRDVRYRACVAVLEEIVFVLQSHVEVRAVFLPSLNTGNDGGRAHQMVDELTQRAIERSRFEQ